MAAMNINEKQFREMVQENKPVLVDFWAPWCTYCRRISPVYEKIADQYQEQMHVVKVNIDDNGALANAERIEVIPTLILYRSGIALGSIVAPESKAAIDRFIQETLSSL